MKTEFGKFNEKMNEGFKKIKQEIEELALQLSLGKADASDKFEELKKEFRQKTEEWKQEYAELKSTGKEKATGLVAALEELQVQLALGKADSKDFLKNQKKQLMEKIHLIEAEVKSDPELQKRLENWRHELEKLKLKLEILEMHAELKSMAGRDKVKNAMEKAEIEIEKIMKKAQEKWQHTKDKSADFNEEMSASFDHLKKAVRSLLKED